MKKRTANSSSRLGLMRPGNKKKPNTWKSPIKKERHFTLPSVFKKLTPHWTFTIGVTLSSIILICSISFGLLYGYRYFTTTKYFHLKHIEIYGNTRLSSRNILDLVKLKKGTNLLQLSINSVEDILTKEPWVQEASVTRVMPDTLVIRIHERTPAFWRLSQGALHYTDVYGSIIGPVEPGMFVALPTLEVEKGAEDLQQILPDLLQSLHAEQIPFDKKDISQVRLSAASGVELFFANRKLRVTIGIENWQENLFRLRATVADLEARNELSKVRNIRAQSINVWVER